MVRTTNHTIDLDHCTRPHLCAALAAGGADEVGLDVGEPVIIGPAVRVGLDVVTASVVAAMQADGYSSDSIPCTLAASALSENGF